MPTPPGPGPHHHHRWIFAHHDKSMTPKAYAAVLRGIADALEISASVDMNGVQVGFGPSLDFELIHEHTPHGSLAFVIRAEWTEELPVPAQHTGTLSISAACEEVGR